MLRNSRAGRFSVPESLQLLLKRDLNRLKAMGNNREDLLRVKDRQGASCVHYAARARSLDVLEYVKEAAGARSDDVFGAKSKIGSSALHDACAAGQ